MLTAEHKANVTKLIDKLKAIDEWQFNIGTWLEGDGACYTVGCIGGWAERCMTEDDSKDFIYTKDVGDWLGLTSHQADLLFHTYYIKLSNRRVRIDHEFAIALLEHYLATGYIEHATVAAKLYPTQETP